MNIKYLILCSISGMSGLSLAACTSTGGPLGGSAANANDAEIHCQKFGKHAEPNSIANNGMITFKCITGDENQAVKEEVKAPERIKSKQN